MTDKKLILRVALKLMALTAAAVVIYVFFYGMFGSNSTERGAVILHVDVSAIKPGEIKYFKVLNKKLLVLHRNKEMLELLNNSDMGLLKDASTADMADNMNAKYRSFTARYFVAWAYDAFYGCDIKLKEMFLEPVCIDLKYDLAGRVLKSGRAEANLIVPAHDMENKTHLRIYAD